MTAPTLGRKLAGLFCLLFALLGLCGCGETDPVCGHYLLLEAEENGLTLEPPEASLTLENGGRGSFTLAGESGAVVWRRSGDTLTILGKEKRLTAREEEGLLTVTDGESMTLIFVREEQADARREELRQRREALARQRELWLGDWYGWWRVENAEGSLEDTWYDLCARFALLEDGSLSLILWDEDQTAEKPMAKLRLALREDGNLTPVDGYFWFTDPGEYWVLGQTDGCIRLAGRHEGEKERFDYLLCLRRWGDRWDGAAQKPYYYETWYLPLLKQGEAMPDEIRKP